MDPVLFNAISAGLTGLLLLPGGYLAMLGGSWVASKFVPMQKLLKEAGYHTQKDAPKALPPLVSADDQDRLAQLEEYDMSIIAPDLTLEEDLSEKLASVATELHRIHAIARHSGDESAEREVVVLKKRLMEGASAWAEAVTYQGKTPEQAAAFNQLLTLTRSASTKILHIGTNRGTNKLLSVNKYLENKISDTTETSLA